MNKEIAKGHKCVDQEILVLLGKHALLFLLDLTGFLDESARVAPEGAAAVSEARSTDTITFTGVSTVSNLENPSETKASSEETVEPAVTTAAITSVFVGVALLFEMFQTSLVLAVDDARAEGSDAACAKVAKAAADTIGPGALALFVGRDVLSVTVDAIGSHLGYGWGLLIIGRFEKIKVAEAEKG